MCECVCVSVCVCVCVCVCSKTFSGLVYNNDLHEQYKLKKIQKKDHVQKVKKRQSSQKHGNGLKNNKPMDFKDRRLSACIAAKVNCVCVALK